MSSLALRKYPPPAHCNEAALVELARSGSEPAVRELVRRNNRLLFRLVRGLTGNDAEAEDVVQEAYFRAFTRLDSFRGEAAFSTWLARIAINEAKGHKRRSRRLAEPAEIELIDTSSQGNVHMFPTLPQQPSPEAEAGRRQIRRMLEKATDRLPPNFRTVFIMREIEGLSAEEVGTILSLRPQTVKTRLHRARKLLRAELEGVLAAGFADLFPFDGARCADMADRVVARLNGRVPDRKEGV